MKRLTERQAPTSHKKQHLQTQHQVIPPFRFLDLPAELRNRIYEFAFEGHHTELLTRWGKDSTIRTRFRYAAPGYDYRFDPPALLSTSRQIRNEAIGLFYAITTFHVSDFAFEMGPLLRKIGRECFPLITSISYSADHPWLWGRSFSPEAVGKQMVKRMETELLKFDKDADLSIIKVVVNDGSSKTLWTTEPSGELNEVQGKDEVQVRAGLPGQK